MAALMDLYNSDLFVCRKFVPITRNGNCNCRVTNLLSFFQYDNEANLSELASIIASGTVSTLTDFIIESGNVRLSDRYGNTPLHLSVIFNKPDIFHHLLSQDGTNVDATNRHGQTCLHLAVLDELEDFALTLIDKGADVNFSDESCCTPLHCASTREGPRMCQLLLDHGADMHAQNLLGKNAIYHACQYGSMETACMLLYYGANAAATDRFGILPLTAAMRQAPDKHDFHEILFNYAFERGKISVNLRTLTEAMKIASPLLFLMLRRVDSVKYSRNDLIELSKTAILIDRESFMMFMKKHTYVVADMLQFSHELHHQLTVVGDAVAADDLVEKYLNFLTMLFEFRRSFNFLKNLRCLGNFGDLFPLLVSLYKDKKLSMATVSSTVCFLYSYGMPCEFDHLVVIYEGFGHCELFKYLLHMDVYVPYRQPKLLMPYLICDVKMTVDKLLNYVRKPTAQHVSILKFFASQKLHSFFSADADLYDRVKQMPEVPSLTELARNSARKAIIKKFKIEKATQFHEVVKRLPISDVYKKILTYERELYKLE